MGVTGETEKEREREQDRIEVVQTRVRVCVDCQQLEVSSTGKKDFTDTNVIECLHIQMHSGKHAYMDLSYSLYACTHNII